MHCARFLPTGVSLNAVIVFSGVTTVADLFTLPCSVLPVSAGHIRHLFLFRHLPRALVLYFSSTFISFSFSLIWCCGLQLFLRHFMSVSPAQTCLSADGWPGITARRRFSIFLRHLPASKHNMEILSLFLRVCGDLSACNATENSGGAPLPVAAFSGFLNVPDKNRTNTTSHQLDLLWRPVCTY